MDFSPSSYLMTLSARVVGVGSYVPTFFHDLPVQIGDTQITAPIGVSERIGVGFNLLARAGVFNRVEVCFNDHTRKLTFQAITSADI